MRSIQHNSTSGRSANGWILALYLLSFVLPVDETVGVVWFVMGLLFQPFVLCGLPAAIFQDPHQLFQSFRHRDGQLLVMGAVWWANIFFYYGWGNLVVGRSGRATVAGFIGLCLASLLLLDRSGSVFSLRVEPWRHAGYFAWLASMGWLFFAGRRSLRSSGAERLSGNARARLLPSHSWRNIKGFPQV